MSLERINPFQGKFQRKISISYIEAWGHKETRWRNKLKGKATQVDTKKA